MITSFNFFFFFALLHNRFKFKHSKSRSSCFQIGTENLSPSEPRIYILKILETRSLVVVKFFVTSIAEPLNLPNVLEAWTAAKWHVL